MIFEHNLYIIKYTDYVINLYPEAGDKGGEIVAVGAPEQISKNERSYTGMFLKKVL